MNAVHDVRPSPIAGQWYSGEPARLAASVDGYLAGARLPQIEGAVMAVIAPHAGHRYSGPVAGYAFAALRDQRPDLVTVLAPMHHPAAPALLTSAHQAYQTPLGEVEIDQQALGLLDEGLQSAGMELTPVRRDAEHSLEIELPFLQRIYPQGFLLLPVMVRDPSERVARALGAALAQVLTGRKAVIVASSDLSHFYPQRVATALDGELLRRVAAFDPLAVLQAEEEGVGFACGRGALAAALWAAQGLGADRVQILHYATSGDVTGDNRQVVGYAAAAITRPPAV